MNKTPALPNDDLLAGETTGKIIARIKAENWSHDVESARLRDTVFEAVELCLDTLARGEIARHNAAEGTDFEFPQDAEGRASMRAKWLTTATPMIDHTIDPT
eukprot:scaffold1439_cov282-Pinguiococcus_pyrenoidosus.AAC.1